MNVEKLDRVLVAVKDLEASAQYFSDLLGLTFDEVHEDPSQNVKYIRTPLGFELIQSTTPDGAVARFIEKRGEGPHHITMNLWTNPSAFRGSISSMKQEVPNSRVVQR